MGALRRAAVWLGLVEEEDERLYDGRYAEEFADEEGFAASTRPPVRPRPAPAREATAADRSARSPARDPRVAERLDRAERERLDRAERERLAEPPRASVRPLARPGSGGTSYPTQDNLALTPPVQVRERGMVADANGRRHQITTLHPTTYREARTIGERFRDGVPVIINLTEMDEPDARRLVDFAAGLTFGLRGSIERVTNRVFLLSPANIQVTAEDKAKIAEGGFFDQG
jgi:cell division inhibitor SepF